MGASRTMRPSSIITTRSAIASARSTRCSERTTAHCACSTAARNASAPSASSWEVGSSSSRSCGRSASADARQTRCSSPPESSTVRRLARCEAPTSSRATATCGQISSGATAMFSRPNATSLSTRVITTWFSGSWKTDETMPASSAGPCDRVSRPPTSTSPGEAATVEVRHEPRQCPQERGLAAARGTEQRHHLARMQLERDVAHGRHAARVGEREPVDPN